MLEDIAPNINHFYGWIIELPVAAALDEIGTRLAGEKYFAKVAGVRLVKYIRLTADQDSDVKGELAFTTSLLGGLTPRNLTELNHRKRTVFRTAERSKLGPDVLRREMDELPDYLLNILKASQHLIKYFDGAVVAESADSFLQIPGFDHPVRIVLMPKKMPMLFADDNATEPVPRIQTEPAVSSPRRPDYLKLVVSNPQKPSGYLRPAH